MLLIQTDSIWILIQTELFPLSEQKTTVCAQEKSFFGWSPFQCIHSCSMNLQADFTKVIELHLWESLSCQYLYPQCFLLVLLLLLFCASQSLTSKRRVGMKKHHQNRMKISEYIFKI